MSGRFVQAAGGCVTVVGGNPLAALETMGEIRLRQFNAKGGMGAKSSGNMRKAQLMIRHPNYSGLQRNQVTQLFIPAFFVSELEVYQGDERLFRMEGGISISEDPVFRFAYTPNGASEFRVIAKDTDGNVFEQSFPIGSET